MPTKEDLKEEIAELQKKVGAYENQVEVLQGRVNDLQAVSIEQSKMITQLRQSLRQQNEQQTDGTKSVEF